MPIKTDPISSYKRGPGWTEETINIIIDDFEPAKEKTVTLTNYEGKPEIFERNLAIQIDAFIAEIKAETVVDVKPSLEKVTTTANVKHKQAIDEMKAVG